MTIKLYWQKLQGYRDFSVLQQRMQEERGKEKLEGYFISVLGHIIGEAFKLTKV